MFHLSRPHLRWSVVGTIVLLVVMSLGSAQAQRFDADRYLTQCLRFEAGGDYSSALEACRNAMQVDDQRSDVQLALARIEVALGDDATAETRLLRLVRSEPSVEAWLLLAQVGIDARRFGDAEGRLARARDQLGGAPDQSLKARYDYLRGRMLEGQGRVRDALDAYALAVAEDGLEPTFRLAAAELRFRLGDAASALAELEAYQQLAGDVRDPRIRSLMGRAYWAEGDLEEAAGQLETALALWSNLDVSEQGRDLRTLGLVYLGQGDLSRGSLALREAGRRGSQVALLGGNTLLWLILVLGLLIVHLLAESRIESSNSLEVIEGPQPWTVGSVYRIVIIALAAGVVAAVLTGMLLYGNLLSVVTPQQATETRAVAGSVFALIATLLTMRVIRDKGWTLAPRLLGPVDTWASGVGIGIGLVIVTLAYLAFRPDSVFLPGLWLNLSYVTPIVLIAAVVLPMSEFTFRPFAYDALEYRYGSTSALLISGSVSTLVFATPVVLLLPFGVLLAELYRRSRSGVLVLSVQLTLHVGLVVAVLVSPWARGLFL